MINNPANIENDIVLEHGRWCLKAAAFPGNRKCIQSIMDRRRVNLKADRVAYCERATL